MRIISWNIHNRVSLWEEVALLDADVALLQEAPKPPKSISSKVHIVTDGEWHTAKGRKGSVRPWRTTIVGLSENVELIGRMTNQIGFSSSKDLMVSRPGILTIANVKLKKKEEIFTLVSMYGIWEITDISTSQNWRISDASVHRLISDISSLIGTQKGHKIIAAGDLNILYGYGELGSTYWKERYDTVFSRMKALGVSFAGPQYPNGEKAMVRPKELPKDSLNVPTYRSSIKKPESATRQLDYVFASDIIHSRMKVTALNSIKEWGLSDHCRILIEIV
jgi:exonuclease III